MRDIAILFFLTLGPLKAILPFVRITPWDRVRLPANRGLAGIQRSPQPSFCSLLGPFVLTTWHVPLRQPSRSPAGSSSFIRRYRLAAPAFAVAQSPSRRSAHGIRRI